MGTPIDLSDRKTLREFLERHGLWAKKAMGQHFLCSASVVEAIMGELRGIAGVLEIGPGPGVLTGPISSTAGMTVAIELDERMLTALFESAPSALVRRADVLQVDLSQVLDELPAPRAVVSNMPYNITGPLLTRIAGARSHFDLAVLMMQKEVGERVAAGPGNSGRGSLSVFLQAQFEVSKVCQVPAGAFQPPPKVDSVVLRFRPKETGLAPGQEARFFKLVRACFRHPRKTLFNNLSVALSREIAAGVLAGANLDPKSRPHTLSLDAWLALWRAAEERPN